MKSIAPMVTVVMTTDCNQRCVYCPPMGESYSGSPGTLHYPVGERLISETFNRGARTYRLSGGEPLLHADIEKYLLLSKSLVQKSGIVHLNTNGVLLDEFKELISSEFLSTIRISLDTLDETKYRQITGTGTFSRVIDNIQWAKEVVPVDLIMVVMKHNLNDVLDMIRFCTENGIGLKLSDLEQHPFDNQGFFTDQYVHFEELHEILERKCDKVLENRTVGGLGIYMIDYMFGSTRVRVKDTNAPALFTNFCRNSCLQYQCPEGVYSILIKPNGNITWCKRNAEIETLHNKLDGEAAIKSCFEALSTCSRESRISVVDSTLQDTTPGDDVWRYDGGNGHG